MNLLLTDCLAKYLSDASATYNLIMDKATDSNEMSRNVQQNNYYCIRGNFGGDFNLAIWRILYHAAKLKSHQYNWSFVIINDVYR